MGTPATAKEAAQASAEAYLGEPVRLRPLPGGEVNQTFRADTATGPRLVIRVNELAELGRFQMEAWCSGEAREAGVQTPSVLSVKAFGDFAVSVQTFVSGELGEAVLDKTELWRDIGRALRRVHGVPVRAFGERPDRPTSRGPQGGWLDHVAYNLTSLGPTDPLGVRGIVGAAELDRLAWALSELARHRGPFGLCHGDPSPQNTVSTESGVVVLDWGCARGHLTPLYDIAAALDNDLSEDSEEFGALLDGLAVRAAWPEMRSLVFHLRLLCAVDTCRWALDRSPQSFARCVSTMRRRMADHVVALG